MGEIKNKLNIKKINAKNLLLLFLITLVMGAISVIVKTIGGKMVKIDSAHAQCWTPAGAGAAGAGESASGSGESASGSGEAGSGEAGAGESSGY